MSEQSTAGGRRSARTERRIDLLVGLAIVLPAVVAICLAVVGSDDPTTPGPQRPNTADLTAATVACPGSVGDKGSPINVTRTPELATAPVDVSATTSIRGASGEAELAERSAIEISADRSTAVDSDGGVVLLKGSGTAAPGLVAGRGERLAVPECRAPSYDEWLVGVGSSARYATSLELVNPDSSEAVVDIELHGAKGELDEPALRGLTVPGDGVRRIDLASVAPRRVNAAAHLVVTRGRVIATARTTNDPLGTGRVSTEFLPADPEPSTGSLILGLPKKSQGARLFVVNPGDDEVRVTPQLVTPQSVFTATDAPEVAVPPHSMRVVPLATLLASDAAEGAIGVRVEATGPVASALHLLVQGDLALLAPTPELTEPAAVVVPAGKKEVILAGATGVGMIEIAAFDADGAELARERVEVTQGSGAVVSMPAKAVSLSVVAKNTAIKAVVSMPDPGSNGGLASLRVLPVAIRGQIPDVAPR